MNSGLPEQQMVYSGSFNGAPAEKAYYLRTHFPELMRTRGMCCRSPHKKEGYMNRNTMTNEDAGIRVSAQLQHQDERPVEEWSSAGIGNAFLFGKVMTANPDLLLELLPFCQWLVTVHLNLL